MEKLTNVKALEMVLEMELPVRLRKKIEKMKTTFEKKNASGSNGKLTPTQQKNEVIKGKILEFLGTVDRATITEIQKVLLPEYPNIANQKVNALVTQLRKNEKKVERVEEKRKAYFFLVKQD